MRKFLFVLLALAVVIIASDARRIHGRCPKNEMYTTCGSACEGTCEKPKPDVCTMQCIEKCVCIDNYLRGPDGRCVKPRDCTRRGHGCDK